MPGRAASPGKRRHRRHSGGDSRGHGGAGRTRLLLSSVVLLVVTLLVIAFFLTNWLRSQMTRRAAPVAAAGSDLREKVSKFPSPSEEEALALVRGAVAVRDTGDVERYYRPGKRSAGEIVAFLESMRDVDGEITGFQWLSSMDANGLLIDGVLMSTRLGESERNRLALLTPDDEGVWKVDFESFARWVEPPWEKLMDGEGGEGRVRVILARDNYFNGPFRDDGEWLCYGMASPDTDQILLGYCRAESPQARALASIFREEGDAVVPMQRLKRATLKVSRPTGAEPRQFEIVRVLAEDWVLAGQAFDGSGAVDGAADLPPLREKP